MADGWYFELMPIMNLGMTYLHIDRYKYIRVDRCIDRYFVLVIIIDACMIYVCIRMYGCTPIEQKFRNQFFQRWNSKWEALFWEVQKRMPKADWAGDPLEAKKIIGEKWCYFQELYKTTDLLENCNKKVKNEISIEIFLCKFQTYLRNFESLIFSPNVQTFASKFLHFF